MDKIRYDINNSKLSCNKGEHIINAYSLQGVDIQKVSNFEEYKPPKLNNIFKIEVITHFCSFPVTKSHGICSFKLVEPNETHSTT